jgi:hypothetical protein
MTREKTKRFDGKVYALRHIGHILRYIKQWQKHYTALGYRVELVREKSIYQLWIRSGGNPDDPGPMPERVTLSHRTGKEEKIIFLGML